MANIQIMNGDWIEQLKTLTDESVQCVVTSPPYWGLRDYGTGKWEGGDIDCDHSPISSRKASISSTLVGSNLNGNHAKEGFKGGKCGKCGATRIDKQLGLEKTPGEYIEKMVAGFREVKRVLRKDGTLWLNLGDSYNGLGKGSGGQGILSAKQHTNKGSNFAVGKEPIIVDAPGLKPKDLVGIPWRVAFALQQPYEEHLIKSVVDRAYIAGLVDGEGCITIQKTKSSHCESFSFPPIVQIRMCDTEAIDCFAELIDVNRSNAELYNSSKEANQRPSYNVKATADKAMKLIADIYPFLHVKRKQAIVAWNHQAFRSARGNQERKEGEYEKERFCKEMINKLNQRVPVDIPSWMIEPKFKIEAGWYLRQDLIWAKPNPMPESVTDRCTKSHEYIFLLTKSAKYVYDNEAIKEDFISYNNPKSKGKRGQLQTTGARNGDRDFSGGFPYPEDGRNKRSVWTINTTPYKEAHFATFPQEIPRLCILAGSKKGDTILDFFCGSGTTGEVALKLDRNFIGIELNQKYVNDLIIPRLENVDPLFKTAMEI